jgi:cell shape-determining protein MreC
VLGIFVFGALFFSLTAGGFIRVFAPVWSGENFISRGVSNLFYFFYSKDALIKENQTLKDKLVSEEILLASTRTLSDTENNFLKNIGRSPDSKIVTAAVLVHPPETPYDVLIIDVGTDSGVQVGQEVALPMDSSTGLPGPKIGTVSEVYKKNSKVTLYSANGQKTNAILERNSIPVQLVGRGGGNFEFSLPRDASVAVGDKILSADITRALVGVVSDIEEQSTDSFKKVLVISAANVYTDNFVTILE